MKTLDEVINELHYWDTCDGFPESFYDFEVTTDALHYLKNYRDTKAWLDLEKQNYAEAVKNCERAEAKYTQMTLDMNRNDPLDWETLKQMEGKPVWVEGYYPSAWYIVREVQKNEDGTEDIILDGFQGLTGIGRDDRYGDVENGWQAYRKERK